MKVEKSSVVNYSNQGVSSPNASTARDMSILQGHASPLHVAPTMVRATLSKTTPPNPTEVSKSVATTMDLIKPRLEIV